MKAARSGQPGKASSHEASGLAALVPLVSFLILAGVFAIGLLMYPESVSFLAETGAASMAPHHVHQPI